MSEMLPSPIEKAIAKVKKASRSDRKAEVNRILRPKPLPDELGTSEIKELLHRRALFVTELRKRGIWP